MSHRIRWLAENGSSFSRRPRAERRSDLAGRRELGLDLLRQAAAIKTSAELRDDAITTLTIPSTRGYSPVPS